MTANVKTKLCDCYITDDGGRCLGTREIDICLCEGEKIKCNFYQHVRKEAEKEIEVMDAIDELRAIQNSLKAIGDRLCRDYNTDKLGDAYKAINDYICELMKKEVKE